MDKNILIALITLIGLIGGRFSFFGGGLSPDI